MDALCNNKLILATFERKLVKQKFVFFYCKSNNKVEKKNPFHFFKVQEKFSSPTKTHLVLSQNYSPLS